ncbi:hypothetical protein [Hyphomicrobium sp.]|uniref:hypothetical protein n=1 Tax=Hyphomicrobium sp. TaxID=82 RepID=UPI001DE2A127|nr:hypothetical protein [Hyphomicrobium sp.]MBY0561544.1 hypothetical protein [Hyphomicrobium sp.]
MDFLDAAKRMVDRSAIRKPGDEELFADLLAMGYKHLRRNEAGDLLGIMEFIYTWGLCVIEDRTSYFKRYCYSGQGEALVACVTWDGQGDPPGNWIVEKPGGRSGPGGRHAKEQVNE